MSHYPFAPFAEKTAGISFTTGQKAEVSLFQRVAPFPRRSNETYVEAKTEFAFAIGIEAPAAALLSVEVNGWSARPYRAPMVFALGSDEAFAGNGDEGPYEFRAAPNPGLVDRSISFRYRPNGGGRLRDQPYLTWKDELGGEGKYVFTAESPGVVISLRMSAAVKPKIWLGKNNPWELPAGDLAEDSWPD